MSSKTDEYVVCVNEHDEPTGRMEKMEAHVKGVLHRAFSVHLYRYDQGQLQFLLQKRAQHKYHSAGLWSNACCSHPRWNEPILDACHRRLREELNIETPIQLHTAGTFIYRAQLDHGLIEHELDHVMYGCFHGETPHPNMDEASELKWFSVDAITSDALPLTAWFDAVHTRVMQYGLHKI